MVHSKTVAARWTIPSSIGTALLLFAPAQAHAEGNKDEYLVCMGNREYPDDAWILTEPFLLENFDMEKRDAILVEITDKYKATFPAQHFREATCITFHESADAWTFFRQHKYSHSVVLAGWHPAPVNPQSRAQTLSLDFEPGDGSGFLHARRGYNRASINVTYRFLLCAGEIQMAYSLDRKSLKHSREYVDKFNGLNPNIVTPGSEPPVPMSVPLAVKITLASPGTPYVATIRDETAGEALGLGCFTGQTARVGFAAKLIGPKATGAQIKAYLDLLRAGPITEGASTGHALLNPDVPVPPAPAPHPRVPVRRSAH